MKAYKNPNEHPVAVLRNKIAKRLNSAIIARNKTVAKSPQNLMLCGKVKAYAECINLITAKYPECFND